MRVFRARFAQDEDAVAHQAAWMRWWRPRGVRARLTGWLGGAGSNAPALIALYAHQAAEGEPAALVFPVDGDAVPPGDGLDEVLVHGEAEPNGCLVVDAAHGLVWPRYNPRPPGPNDPRR
jgi:hypothetical protein